MSAYCVRMSPVQLIWWGSVQTSVGDYGFNERGFVVRVYENSCYMEYSFNEYEEIEELAAKITGTLKKELSAMEALGMEKMEAPLIHEEKMEKTMSGEIGEDPTAVSPEEILARLKKISDTGAAGKFVIDFRVAAQFAHVNKLFLSEKKDLMQDVCFCRRHGSGHWRRRGKAGYDLPWLFRSEGNRTPG